jgi:hypothetical protein
VENIRFNVAEACKETAGRMVKIELRSRDGCARGAKKKSPVALRDRACFQTMA